METTKVSSTEKALYKLTDETLELERQLEENGGELTEEALATYEDLLVKYPQKIDSVYGVMLKKKDQIDALKAKMKEMETEFKAIIKGHENSVAWLESYLISQIEKTEKSIIGGELKNYKVKKPKQVLKIDSEENIPLEFFVTKKVTAIDKKGLLLHIKAEDAEKIEGVSLVDGKKSISLSRVK